MESSRGSSRQLKLFPLENPFSSRFGAGYFQTLPREPGVYFFYEKCGRLLYIGQSLNLRARVGSYRHVTPEKSARRTLRLVHRVARIEWQVCTTAREAVETEARLLLEHRPPFNRAGVWQGDPWWLELGWRQDAEGRSWLRWKLTRGREGPETAIGPLPAGFRQAFGSAMRCLHRLAFPDPGLAQRPRGFFDIGFPLEMTLVWPDAEPVVGHLLAYVRGEPEAVLNQLSPLCAGRPELEQAYWLEEVEAVRRFVKKLARAELAVASPAARISESLPVRLPRETHPELPLL